MADRPAFTCPICGRVSHNPHDLRWRYCDACKVFVDDVDLAEALKGTKHG